MNVPVWTCNQFAHFLTPAHTGTFVGYITCSLRDDLPDRGLASHELDARIGHQNLRFASILNELAAFEPARVFLNGPERRDERARSHMRA